MIVQSLEQLYALDDHQKLFDHIKNHLIEQNEQASCRYRHKKEDKILACAVGCLIPDELYDPSLEGEGVGSLFYNIEKIPLFLKKYVEDLRTFQSIHDTFYSEFIANAEYIHNFDDLNRFYRRLIR